MQIAKGKSDQRKFLEEIDINLEVFQQVCDIQATIIEIESKQ